MATLKGKQAKFVEEYLIDLNATQAAVRAGYSAKTARVIGQENLIKPAIQAAIQEAKQSRSQKTGITAERVLQEFARIAFFDPRNLLKDDGSPKELGSLDDDTAAAIAGLELQDVYEGFGDERQFVGYTKKYKIAPKLQALEMLAKHTGLVGRLDEALKQAQIDKLRRDAQVDTPEAIAAALERMAERLPG